MQKAGDNGRRVHTVLGKNLCGRGRMYEIGLARVARLPLVRLPRELVGLLDERRLLRARCHHLANNLLDGSHGVTLYTFGLYFRYSAASSGVRESGLAESGR